jgi:hypothetical protein
LCRVWPLIYWELAARAAGAAARRRPGGRVLLLEGWVVGRLWVAIPLSRVYLTLLVAHGIT